MNLRPLLGGAISLVCVSAAGCSSKDSKDPVVVVHTYTSPALGSDGSVNAYFVETPNGIVVIDGLRTIHEARAALADLKTLGKPIKAVMLTHPHPDHLGGLGVFAAAAAPGTPVYGSLASRDEIVNDPHGYMKASVVAMGGDFPTQPTLPTTFVADGDKASIDGVDFAFSELGDGEAVGATVITLPSAQIAFVGDVTSNRMTPLLIEGRSEKWLHQLDVLSDKLATMVRLYPGHGRDGSPDGALAAQRDYLQTFRDLVDQNRNAAGVIDAAAHGRVVDRMAAIFVGYPCVVTMPELLDKNIDAVAKELASPSAE